MHVDPRKIRNGRAEELRERRLLKIGDVARKINRSVSSCWNDVAEGRLPKPIKIGGGSYWVEDEIDDLIERLIAERDGEEVEEQIDQALEGAKAARDGGAA